MKKLFLIHILAALLYIGGFIWTIFEIIFYVVDKDPINWFSVALLVFGILLGLANIGYAFISKSKKW